MFKTERDHIIWDENITQEEIDEYIADMREEYPDEDESTLEEWARQSHADQLDDEKANLGDIHPKNGILGLAVLGLWNGSPSAPSGPNHHPVVRLVLIFGEIHRIEQSAAGTTTYRLFTFH